MILDLDKGFVLGEWLVEPMLGRVSTSAHSAHVEPKVMEVLLCLAQAQGDTVSREQLLNKVWSGVVVSEEVLTRAISELRSLLGDTAREKRYIRTLPKRGYSLIMPVEAITEQAQEPAALQEPAREPVKPADATASDLPVGAESANGTRDMPWGAQLVHQFIQLLQSVVKTTGKVVLYCIAIIFGVVTLLGVVAIVADNDAEVIITASDDDKEQIIGRVIHRLEDKLAGRDEPEALAPARTIAVLPFVNLSQNVDQDYFADGVSEDIRDALIRVPDVKVVARTSSRVFKDQVLDVRDIGSQLGADVLVEGTVRLQGQRARVTVQLTDAQTGYPIWAGSFDRNLDDAFAIQREIAQEVASKLELQLSPSSVINVTSKAYEKYLLGRHYWHQRTAESLQSARREFSEAIALQPDYALAYSGLADVYTLSMIYDDMPREQALSQAQENVDIALALDPRLAEAHASQGIILSERQQLEASRRSYERAVQLKPAYSMARMWLGNVLMEQGELDQAYNQYSQALDNDPLHPSIQMNYLAALQMQGRFDEALKLSDQFYQQSKSEGLLKQRLNTYKHAGRYDQVLEFAAVHNFPAEHQKHIHYEIIDALIRLKEADRAQMMLKQYRDNMDAWPLAQLDMEIALLLGSYESIEAIAKRVENIAPEDMWDNKSKCNNTESVNLARADYWRGLGAYGEADYVSAGQLFDRAQQNGSGCWMEPDIELSLLLYRADIAGIEENTVKKRRFLREVERRINELRGQGWGHLRLQVSELVYYMLTSQSDKLQRALNRMQNQNVQPMGVAVIDPLMRRHHSFAETRSVFSETEAEFSAMQERGRGKQLVKFGL